MNYYQRNIKLSPKNKRYLNTVRHDNIDYVLTPLSNSSRGGNSNVFNIEDPNDNEIRIIKFCKYDLNNPNKETRKRIARFAREIEALQLLKKNGSI